VIYRQGPHQTDVVRCVGGGMVKSVRAVTGRWNTDLPLADGSYTAFLQFEDGTSATMVMSGYGYFNSEELTWGFGESGEQHDPLERRRHEAGPIAPQVKYGRQQEREERARRAFQQIYGLTIASCERGDLRQSPHGLYVYDEEGRTEVPCAVDYNWEGLHELCAAIREDRAPFPDAHWAMATVDVCLAIMQFSREGQEIPLSHQVPCPL
jgi:phthalate 4,5-cis-dihydrodiol dehydrogenase